MRLKIALLFLSIAVLLSVEPGEIVINEICFNPDGPDEEWIELHNNMRSEIILDSTVYISDGEGVYHFDGLAIPGGGFVTMMSRTDGSFPFTADLDISDAGIQLSNSQDEVFIVQGETVIDSMKYFDSWISFEGHTFERRNPLFTALHPLNWVSSIPVEGTPGEVNSTHESPTEFPPAILKLNHSPSIPTSSDNPEIMAMVIDEHALASIELYYFTTADTAILTLTEVTEDHYSGDIESYTHGDMISYYVIAVDDEGQADTSGTQSYFIIDSLVEGPVVINEIMYDSPGEDNEWVELYNRTSDAIDLEGWTLKDGSSSYFTFPEATILEGNGFIVAVKSEDDFTAEYSIDNYIGNFPFSLNNSGDSLILKNADGRMIDILEYKTGSGWPPEAHGDGYSLELNNSETDNSDPESWSGSAAMGGTPGGPNEAIVENKNTKLPDELDLIAISPNPFNSSFRVDFDIVENSNATLRVLNTEGRIMIERNSIDCNEVINADGFESGVYIIQIESDGNIAQAKAVLIK